ncbi:MAG: proline dehydrogenase family protein [Parachlamydiales bacterium]|jgi:RHH-type proline utilization regulon transcriptional repressor/proline dehydrogenase/delta 1-pyrroline-5-carboxylate dehydrogenase
MDDKKFSYHLDQAAQLLNASKNTILSFDDKLRKSTELAELLILHAKQSQSPSEKAHVQIFSKILNNSKGKAFLSNLIDQFFRSKSLNRALDQFSYLLLSYGSTRQLSWMLKFKIFTFKLFSTMTPKIFYNLIKKNILKECLNNFNYADTSYLFKYLQKNKNNQIAFWILQNKIFGEKSLDKSIRNIINLITKHEISSFCINLSSLTSQLSIPFNNLAKIQIEENLIKIFKALQNTAKKNKSIQKEKLIILDFEEHSNLDLALEIFEKIIFLDDFLNLPIGFTLKSYFPESYEIQKKLTELAKKRKEKNGACISIRITKGIHLNLELINSSKNNWPSPTYNSKIETDANFKRMINFGSKPENAKAANIIISTSNIFDIAYSLLLLKENNLEEEMFFEIIDSKTTSPVISTLKRLINKNLILFCPIVFKKDQEILTAYLLQRINDFINPENFISQQENLFPGTKNWDEQIDNFKQSFKEIPNLISDRKFKQNRTITSDFLVSNSFDNDPITDFSIKENIEWAQNIIEKAKQIIIEDVPLVINGKEVKDTSIATKILSNQNKYNYFLADDLNLQKAIESAKEYEKKWQGVSIGKKYDILSKASSLLKKRRAFFIKNLILDIEKNLAQSDLEVSDAIDSIEYQIKNFINTFSNKDIDFKPKGTIVVIPAWGFPLSVSATAITSALIAGNVVILKPLEESVLVCYQFASLLWEAGVPKECLQFVNCPNKLFEKNLISDPRINSVIISTSAENAKKLTKMRGGLELLAASGGINTIIVTAISDKDLAIENIIDSAFSYSGQKLSSASVLILEKEVYDDEEFRYKLKEAAENLITDTSFNLNATITPLIKDPKEDLKTALCTLDKNEWWLVKPKQDENNSRLFSCGVKFGVTLDSFTKNHELYGPVLSVMRANNLDHAIELANKSKFGLSAGLQSLDSREHVKWINSIQAGNYYINTKLTETKIKRQPFGGYKESSFGSGYKLAGPNYNLNFLTLTQISLPKEKQPVNDWVNSLTSFLEKIDLSAEELGLWYASVANYAYSWKKLKQDIDSCKLLGQDNFLRYVPRKNITFRLTSNYLALDALRVCAAALTCSTPIEISWSTSKQIEEFNWIDLLPVLTNIEESEDEFLSRVKLGKIKRVRLTNPASKELKKAAAQSACCIIDSPILANGRFELLHYIKEINITYDYHRYGNLGLRESELRKPLQ